MNMSKKINQKREDILRIARKYGAKNLRLFGSVSRGEKKTNDVDILVKMERSRSLLDIIALKQDLEDLLGCPVDVVTENSISPYLKDEIFKEAVNL